MEKTKENVLKTKYGMNKASYKYVPAGAEILKYIDQVVIYVSFTKKEDGQWDSSYERAKIISIKNFDPMTMTYDCVYKLESGGEDGKERTMKIIPEGFSFENPDETGKMARFVPYSIHCKMVEDETFIERLKVLYDTRETMKLEYLSNITKSKGREALLKYSNNIGAVVKLNDGDLLWIRIHDLSLYHKNGTKYSLRFDNDERHWSVLIDSSDKEYDFEGVGKFKIIDLSD